MSNIKTPLKILVAIGTAFFENNHPCIVTRVTDIEFDTLDKETGRIRVRNLRAWETDKFVNSISGVTGLLRLGSTKENREWMEKASRNGL